jgi:hypothetical protein
MMKTKFQLQVNLDTGPALECSYNSLSTQDPIWRMWFVNCPSKWMVQAL